MHRYFWENLHFQPLLSTSRIIIVIKTLFKSTGLYPAANITSTGTLVVKPIFSNQLTPQIISSHKIIIHKLMVLSNYILSPTK